MYPNTEKDEFQKRERAAKAKYHEQAVRITTKYRAGHPEQTKTEKEEMGEELWFLPHPPYHHHFHFDFADLIALSKYHEIGPALDTLFPSPDEIDIQYLDDIIFTVMSPSQAEGRLQQLRRGPDLDEKAKRVRVWLNQKKQVSARATPHIDSHAIADVSISDCNTVGNTLELVTFHNGFTAEKADQVAESELLGITKGGRFALGTAKKSAVTGFIEGLAKYGVLTYPNLGVAHSFFGARYGVEVKTDRATKARTHYREKTLKEVRRLFPR